MDNPIEGMWANAQAHPVQTGLSALAGMLVPGGGFAAGRLFNRYNNSQMNNRVNNSANAIEQQGMQAGNAAMDRPLNGPMGQMGSPQMGSTFNMNQQFIQPNYTASQQGNPLGLLDFLGTPPGYKTPFMGKGAYREAIADGLMDGYGGGSNMSGVPGHDLPGGGYYGGGISDGMNGASNQMRASFAAASGGDANNVPVYKRIKSK